MYLGYARLGATELANSSRQHAYAAADGVTWLTECEWCESLEALLPRGLDGQSGTASKAYVGVKADPAPWYSATNPDSEGFYGFSLLDLTGMENSTRTVTMTSSIIGGGSAGKAYYKHREMVAKLLLAAEDECSLSYGYDWMKTKLNAAQTGVCAGVEFFYYTCCPCLCDPDVTQLEVDCLVECIDPYFRKLKGVIVTGGPSILKRHSGLSCGAAMTVELNLAAGDPGIFPGKSVVLLSADVMSGDVYQDSVVAPVLLGDPFRPDLVPVELFDNSYKEPVPTQWMRTLLPVDIEPLEEGPFVPTLLMTAEHGDVAGVRVGLQRADEVLGSWFVRRIPDGGTVVLEPVTGTVEVEYQGITSTRQDIVIGGDGGPPMWTLPLDRADLQVVVDRADGAPVQVDLLASTVWR